MAEGVAASINVIALLTQAAAAYVLACTVYGILKQGFAWEGLPLSSSLTSSSLLGSTMDVDDDEWTMI